MKTLVLRVTHATGLHARPAALFVQAASGFASGIQVRSLTQATPFVDAKSILGILTLGVEQGHEIELHIDGPDEQQALEALAAMIRSNFEGRLG